MEEHTKRITVPRRRIIRGKRVRPSITVIDLVQRNEAFSVLVDLQLSPRSLQQGRHIREDIFLGEFSGRIIPFIRVDVGKKVECRERGGKGSEEMHFDDLLLSLDL